MPTLIEDVVVLHLDGEPNGELSDFIFTKDTKFEIPQYLPIYNGVHAVGLATITAIDMTMLADAVIYEDRVPFLPAHSLKLMCFHESSGGFNGGILITKTKIQGLALYHNAYGTNEPRWRLPMLKTYQWTNTEQLKISTAV